MRKKAPLPRQKDRADSEMRLLDAAKKVFAEKGFSAATTRAIAQKSGINLALITRYFKNKQGLFMAVLERDILEHRAKDIVYAPCETFVEECLAYPESRFRHHTQDVEYFRMVIGQFVADRKIFKKLQDKLLKEPASDAFQKRVTTYFTEAGVDDPDEARRFTERVGMNVVSSVLFDVIIRGIPAKTALEDLQIFIRQYCNALTDLRKIPKSATLNTN